MFNRKGKVVCHAHVFPVPHGEKGEAHVDRPHRQSVVAGPDRHLNQVIPEGRGGATSSIAEFNNHVDLSR